MTVEVHRANTGDLKTLSDRLVLDVQGKGRRLSTRTIRAIVKARYRQAGVVGHRKTTHSLRHSAITNTIRHKATPIQVQAMTRHTSTHTTLGYFYGENRTANLAGEARC